MFLFGSVRQTKLALRQLFGTRKYSVWYRIVSWQMQTLAGKLSRDFSMTKSFLPNTLH